MIDTDNDQVVTLVIILIIIIIGMTEEIQHKENKMIDIIQKIEEQREINTTITKKRINKQKDKTMSHQELTITNTHQNHQMKIKKY